MECKCTEHHECRPCRTKRLESKDGSWLDEVPADEGNSTKFLLEKNWDLLAQRRNLNVRMDGLRADLEEAKDLIRTSCDYIILTPASPSQWQRRAMDLLKENLHVED